MNKILDFIKSQIILIVCGAVFLVGIGIFVLSFFMNNANAESMGKVQSAFNTARNLSSGIYTNADVKNITNVARRVAAEKEKAYQAAYVATNRPVLFDKVFPEPEAMSAILYYRQFAASYCDGIDTLMNHIGAGNRLSDIDVERIMEDYKRRPAMMGGGEMGGMGGYGMGAGRSVMRGTSEYKILEEKMLERARNIKIYANTDSFCCYAYWKNLTNSEIDIMIQHSWYTQLAWWIQEDVILSIDQINGANTVLKNPVKRLIEIGFMGESVGKTSGGSGSRDGMGGGGLGGGSSSRAGEIASRSISGGQSILPVYVAETAEKSSSYGSASGSTNLTGQMTTPLTDRISNDLVDVVHFRVSVVIERPYIIDFINALQDKKELNLLMGNRQNPRNQITVLDSTIEPIEMEAEKDARYLYGSGAMALLRLNCEYIFVKNDEAQSGSAYQNLKPQQIKDILNPPEPANQQQGNMYYGY